MKRSYGWAPSALLLGAAVAACAADGSSPDAPTNGAGGLDLDQVTRDGGKGPANIPAPDGGSTAPDSTIAFVTKVVSFTPGACAGFGSESMPDIVLGPPKGGGDDKGSLDVVSLGRGGEIVLSFEPNAIVDRPGDDFIVFENAFFPNGDTSKPYVELAEVSVSEDGETWTAFPCTATAAPYGACAGWRPVYAFDDSPTRLDPRVTGGDAFDLASIGVASARFVRIKDKTSQRCTSQGPNNNGFDLDAIGVIHVMAR